MEPRARVQLDPGEDARLVALCLRGDARAWESLVRRYERLVFSVARSYRLSDEDLGDVFQEVFAALVRGLPRLRDARALCRWISTTTDYIAHATARKRWREQALTGGAPDEVEEAPADLPPVGANLEELEEQALVRLALSAVPERCRRLLEALYYEDPPPAYSELARRLGVPVGSLGPTRARCLERMRVILEGISGKSGSISPAPATTSRDVSERPPHSRARALAATVKPVPRTEDSP